MGTLRAKHFCKEIKELGQSVNNVEGPFTRAILVSAIAAKCVFAPEDERPKSGKRLPCLECFIVCTSSSFKIEPSQKVKFLSTRNRIELKNATLKSPLEIVRPCLSKSQ